jgi:hypothetical protein
MDDLKTQAEELGITVDDNWSEAELQAEIDKALAAPAKPAKGVKPAKAEKKAEAKTPVKLLYDTWLVEDERTPAGKVIEVTITDAKRLIAAGKAERADPLPGDDA